ncbi:RNA polymerase sigma factor [Arundinibacter roseus]|uniref:RNA polymerase sigma-70 factor n=1 Tax=Arundinibacter roseus TaxID=2070510 RepID=A0A4R4K5I8_9BACT|nr:RNA polymerase sigma-70 factor [Arundinibacter roseus]TDB61766.1 RNA polymerase sigma-70 factor [Arundinibacter roseus]
MNQPNERMLRNVIRGDQKAFAELYSYYRTPALKFCVSLLKDEEEAENVLHEVFIRIWDRRAHINPELNFNSYLFTCLRNFAFDYFKRLEKNNQLRQTYLDRMTSAQFEEADDSEERIKFVNEMVNSLSEKRKKILILNVYEGKSYQEIAELMKISKNTVKNQLVKAKQILREQLTFVYT